MPDMTSPATTIAIIEVWKTAENAASDSFGSNFSGAAFCLPYQMVGILFIVIIKSSTDADLMLTLITIVA